MSTAMGPVTFMVVFARFLDGELKGRGLKANALAARMGLAKSSVSGWKGANQIEPATFDALLAALKMDHATAFRAMALAAEAEQEKRGAEPVRVDEPGGSALVAPGLMPLVSPVKKKSLKK